MAKKAAKKAAKKTAKKKKQASPARPSRQSTSTAAAPAAAGFAFANPQPSGDDFEAFTKNDIQADSALKASDLLQPIPKPREDPPVMALADVLGTDAVQQITAAKSITLHCVGDTGGIHEPANQFAVADAMAADLEGKTYQSGRPALFYHLGDVVYYLGQELYYYEQFYDPYRDYDGPILGIPGNHDGMVSPSIKQKTLQGFLDNFCTAKPAHNPDAQGHARTTMTQPGVYFTLDAPFVKIIGLYSNISEGTTSGVLAGKKIGDAQLTFLQQQLKTAAQQRQQGDNRALLIAVHHPPFTGSSKHAPSPAVLKDIDAACKQANIQPDMVLSGHAHLYERYTRVVGHNQIPFLVAGCGGYYNLSGLKPGKHGTKPTTPASGTDGVGNKLTLETYNDTDFGYLTLTVSAAQIDCKFVTVDVKTQKTAVDDHFTLDLTHHSVTNH
ncbi:MAG TPA: metallophosphoesterase [Xanthobacteraceae bacterium]|nr:metallophosphoesterase [Xanthobacteraceae bacterium]